jgi:hypothetical protein
MTVEVMLFVLVIALVALVAFVLLKGMVLDLIDSVRRKP